MSIYENEPMAPWIIDYSGKWHHLDKFTEAEYRDPFYVAKYVERGLERTAEFLPGAWQQATEQHYHYIPAVAGHFALVDPDPIGTLGTYAPILSAVVAWRIMVGYVLPITLDPAPTPDIPPILRPDGQVEASDDGIFPSLAAYIAYRNNPNPGTAEQPLNEAA